MLVLVLTRAVVVEWRVLHALRVPLLTLPTLPWCAVLCSVADLQAKCGRALQAIVAQCTYLTSMQPLLDRAPPEILKGVLAQYEKVVPVDPAMRRALVQSGGLRAVQSVPQSDDAIAAMVESINSNYPEEVVAYCSPDFSQTLADRIGGHK